MYPLTQAPREGFTEHSVDSLGSESLLGPCLTVHCSHIMVHLDKSHEFLTLCLLSNFASFFVICGFFLINFYKKIFEKYHQCVKQFGSRSGPTFCRA